MNVTVIIPTYNRAECLGENLSRLNQQERPPEQIIIVDASTDDRTEQVCSAYPSVLYLRNPTGRGNTPHSRNLALRHATGEILAFLDDDAFVHPGWGENLRASYADESIAGVAGRALNGQPGEEKEGVDQIGRLLPDGEMTGNFAADPGRILEVDHMIGCNMSLRASVVGRLGGFRDEIPLGPFCLMEETDMCLRVRRLGCRLIFNPAVCVDHVGARQPGGRRFSPKYNYYHYKNNFAMLLWNYGARGMAAAHVFAMTRKITRAFVRKVGGALVYLTCSAAGLIAGLFAGLYWLSRLGSDPVRRNADGQAIREQLSAPPIEKCPQ